VAGVLFTPLNPDALGLARCSPPHLRIGAALFGASTRRVGRHRRPLDRRRRIDAVGLRLGDRGQLQEAIAFVAIVMVLLIRRRALVSKEVERV